MKENNDTHLDPSSMPDTEPFEYGSDGVYVSPEHGAYHFRNGILVRATISPSAYSNRQGTVEYRFVRTQEKCAWIKPSSGAWGRYGAYLPPGTPDPPDERTQDIVPSYLDHIYKRVEWGHRNCGTSVWIEMGGNGNFRRKTSGNSIGSGHITIGTGSSPPGI